MPYAGDRNLHKVFLVFHDHRKFFPGRDFWNGLNIRERGIIIGINLSPKVEIMEEK